MEFVKASVIKEFQINQEMYKTELLTSNYSTVTADTVYDYYIEQQEKYKGCTRLYIGKKIIFLSEFHFKQL